MCGIIHSQPTKNIQKSKWSRAILLSHTTNVSICHSKMNKQKPEKCPNNIRRAVWRQAAATVPRTGISQAGFVLSIGNKMEIKNRDSPLKNRFWPFKRNRFRLFHYFQIFFSLASLYVHDAIVLRSTFLFFLSLSSRRRRTIDFIICCLRCLNVIRAKAIFVDSHHVFSFVLRKCWSSPPHLPHLPKFV